MPETHTTVRPRRIRLLTRSGAKRLGVLALVVIVLLSWLYFASIHMPGESFSGPLPPATEQQLSLTEQLRNDVEHLASTIGPRNSSHPESYLAATEWVEGQLAQAGYVVHRQDFDGSLPEQGIDAITCTNLEVEVAGSISADEIVIIGAHYDSFRWAPGANDNGSGVAVCLALARSFRELRLERTVRFVFFANEEPPYFQSHAEKMGSWVYAMRCRERDENIVAMISLETLGYYSDEPGSQQYPAPLDAFYPETGHFIGFVSNIRSRHLLKQLVRSFREEAQFPSEGGAPWGGLPGVGWSDHWSFWQAGYPALMVTDTATYRYPYYHTTQDTPDKLDYDKMARVTTELERIFLELANSDE